MSGIVTFALLVLSTTHAFAQGFTLVDDTDPRIEFTMKWSRIIGDGQFNGGVMLTKAEGATATLLFNGTTAVYYLDYLNIITPELDASTTNASNSKLSPKEGITAGAAAGIALGVATCFFTLIILTYIWWRKHHSCVREILPFEDNFRDPDTCRADPVISIRDGDIVRPYQVPIGAANTEARIPKTLMSGLASFTPSQRPRDPIMAHETSTSHPIDRDVVSERNSFTSPPAYNSVL
ncbi:hypothetical protein BU17DRAFT_85567 [Hysterangium stoloniferum]|nr:hypothetical protein BU17DRAFT_85567 [Hysterangium stoloniferum]